MTVDLKIACRNITLVRIECLYWSIRFETPVWSTLCHWTNTETPLQNASILGPIHTERQPKWKRKLSFMFVLCTLIFFRLLFYLFCFWSHFFLGVNRPIALQLQRVFIGEIANPCTCPWNLLKRPHIISGTSKSQRCLFHYKTHNYSLMAAGALTACAVSGWTQ